jgi:hypothetical protein
MLGELVSLANSDESAAFALVNMQQSTNLRMNLAPGLFLLPLS